MKKQFFVLLILIYSLQFSHANAAFDMDEFNSFVDEHLSVDSIATDVNQTKQQIQLSQNHIQDLSQDFSQLDSTTQRYIHQSAILQSLYSEYLLKQHCPLPARSFKSQAEKLYLKLLNLHPNDRYLRYNLGLHYARHSVYFRKNSDQSPRLALLESAESIQKKLLNDFPNNKDYQTQYYAVLSDTLDLLLKKDSQPEKQKQIIDILKKPLFQMLKNPNQDYDSGNFINLVQQYYKYLYKENPKNAIHWLKAQQKNIESQIKNNQLHNKREYAFLAEFYSLLDQPTKALHYLNLLDPDYETAPTPYDLEHSIALANIKLQPKFQTWFQQYQKQYQAFLNKNPEQCTIE